MLLADDCRDFVDSMGLLIKAWGHEPLCAFNGSQAIGLAQQHCPDISFLDLAMPGANGITAAGAIRPVTPLLVALTGYGDEAHRQLCRDAGFDILLLKPCDPVGLRELLMMAQEVISQTEYSRRLEAQNRLLWQELVQRWERFRQLSGLN